MKNSIFTRRSLGVFTRRSLGVGGCIHKRVGLSTALFFLLAFSPISAQGGLLLDNGRMTCNSSIKIVIENGKWKNTSSTFDQGNSTVKFTGNASAANSVIEGNTTTFYNLELAKSQNNLRLLSSMTNVVNDLTFTSKNIDLNGKTISVGAGGDLVLESENARTYSALPLSSVTRSYSMNNPSGLDFGGMGLRITATGNFSTVTVDRRHKAQTLPTGDGIQKYWRVSTANNPGAQNATLRFNYFDAELNSLNEADLTLWRSINNGTSWTNMGFASRSATSNFVEQTALADISGWWTLGAATPFSGPGGDRATEIEGVISEATWSIFPNPASQWVKVSVFSSEEKTMQLELISTDGKVAIRSQKLVSVGENTFFLDLGSLSPGVYFARIVGQPFQPIRLLKLSSK
ncbi:MAG: T9SS type A sorting domain-containing protein [Phycisphaerae bacterium]|nr:T9SS type A sorting domain-containing protein [Saprospiraceae bacterium]